MLLTYQPKTALLTYQPETSPIYRNGPRNDGCQMSVLLYKRINFYVLWRGLSEGGTPRIERAWAERTGVCTRRLYRVEIDPTRLRVVSRTEFSAWYDAHWVRHHGPLSKLNPWPSAEE